MTADVVVAPISGSEDVGSPRQASPECGQLDQLLAGCARAEQSALAQLYEATSVPLYTLLRRRFSSSRDADDALVAVYVKVWQRAADFASANLSAWSWLTSIALASR